MYIYIHIHITYIYIYIYTHTHTHTHISFSQSATTYIRFRLAQSLSSQLSLFCATFFQLPMFMLFISTKTSSSQRVLGLLIGLLDMGFHLLIFCTILSSAMRSTWPNHFHFCFFLINSIIHTHTHTHTHIYIYI